jgi:hypothetical protein
VLGAIPNFLAVSEILTLNSKYSLISSINSLVIFTRLVFFAGAASCVLNNFTYLLTVEGFIPNFFATAV